MLWENLNSIVWDEISIRITSNQEFVAGEPVTSNHTNPTNAYILISSDGKFHFLISAENIFDNDILHPNAAGLNIEILRNHPVSDVPRQDYIDIFCTGRHHIEAFTEIIREISRNIFERDQQSVNAVNNVIRKWKSFWGKPPSEVLGIDEQVGLIGELIILETLVTCNFTHPVEAWNNPLYTIHDFVFSNGSLEIKTTRRNEHKHIINGMEQLEPLPDRNLKLISVIALEENEGISLCDKVQDLIHILENQPDQCDLFLERISRRGYRPEHEEHYNQNRFRLTDIRMFNIDTHFPKLVNASLISPLPVNISDVRYTLDLEGLNFESLDALHPGQYFF